MFYNKKEEICFIRLKKELNNVMKLETFVSSQNANFRPVLIGDVIFNVDGICLFKYNRVWLACDRFNPAGMRVRQFTQVSFVIGENAQYSFFFQFVVVVKIIKNSAKANLKVNFAIMSNVSEKKSFSRDFGKENWM